MFAKNCREYLKSCTCASKEAPWECNECTIVFLKALVRGAKVHGMEVGEYAI
jgi:hypothetical protein